MRNFFRIFFCILSCLCVAAAFPVGALCPLPYLLIPIGAAALFALLMMLCKNGIRRKPAPKPDFMRSDEENRRLNEQLTDQ